MPEKYIWNYNELRLIVAGGNWEYIGDGSVIIGSICIREQQYCYYSCRPRSRFKRL